MGFVSAAMADGDYQFSTFLFERLCADWKRKMRNPTRQSRIILSGIPPTSPTFLEFSNLSHGLESKSCCEGSSLRSRGVDDPEFENHVGLLRLNTPLTSTLQYRPLLV
jgi:hypothetical protein